MTIIILLAAVRPFSTSFTTAAYGSHQNVFIRLDPMVRPPSANSGSYATIASLNKYPSDVNKKSCNIFESKSNEEKDRAVRFSYLPCFIRPLSLLDMFPIFFNVARLFFSCIFTAFPT